MTRDPKYNVNSAALIKHRSKAADGLSALTVGERRAYGAAVSAAVLASLRATLLAYPAKVRRARTPAQWQAMYDATMADKHARLKRFDPSTDPDYEQTADYSIGYAVGKITSWKRTNL